MRYRVEKKPAPPKTGTTRVVRRFAFWPRQLYKSEWRVWLEFYWSVQVWTEALWEDGRTYHWQEKECFSFDGLSEGEIADLQKQLAEIYAE